MREARSTRARFSTFDCLTIACSRFAPLSLRKRLKLAFILRAFANRDLKSSRLAGEQ